MINEKKVRCASSKVCTVCGQEFQPNSNRAKYCEKCGVEVKRQQAAERIARWKEKHYR